MGLGMIDTKGDKTTEGTLFVGAGVTLRGDVEVPGAASVDGKFEGTLKAKTLVELKPHARVNGEITTASLVIERGAQFDGTVKMTKA